MFNKYLSPTLLNSDMLYTIQNSLTPCDNFVIKGGYFRVNKIIYQLTKGVPL